MLRLIRKFRKSERGASILEMAVVSPFLIFLGLGTFEFGLTFYHYHLISTGLRDGARYLARVNDPVAEANKGKEIAIFGQIGGTVRRVHWWGAGVDPSTTNLNVVVLRTDKVFENAPDPTTGLSPYRGGDPIVIIRLSTDVNHPGLGFLPILGITTPFRINIFHEERFIGD